MKRIFSIILAVVFIISASTFPSDVSGAAQSALVPDTSWYDATSNSFEIDTAEDLAGLASIVNGTATGITKDSFYGKTVKLTKDIDIDNREWTPIGTLWDDINEVKFSAKPDLAKSDPFEGTFDGGGFTISNMKISGTKSGIGLFAYLGDNSFLKNLTVTGVVSGRFHVSGVAAVSGGNVKNVVSRINVDASGSYAGGILAEGIKDVSIESCGNEGSVSNSTLDKSTGRVAGIMGTADYGVTGSIEKCYNTGTIKGYQYVAGIIGGQYGNVDVDSCYNKGNITGVSFGKVYLGSISGKCETGTISNCYNTGTLTDEHWSDGNVRAIGGIAGCEEDRDGGVTAISRCYTTGAININTSNITYGEKWIYEVGNISGGNSSTDANTMIYDKCFYLEGRIPIADSANASYKFWDEIYRNNPLIWDTAYIKSKTESELKASTFPEELGEAFCADGTGSTSLNGGYPVLKWQVGQTSPETEYSIAVPVIYGSDTALAEVREKAFASDKIEITVKDIEATKELKKIEVTDAAGNSLPVTLNSTGGSFVMPKRAVSSIKIYIENKVIEGEPYDVSLPNDLDPIWSISADSAGKTTAGKYKEGSTVIVQVARDRDALASSLKGITVKTKSGALVSCSTYGETKDVRGKGISGEYAFVMPSEDVDVTLDAEYEDFKVYVKKGSQGEPTLVKTYSRADMTRLARHDLKFTGYSGDKESFVGKAALGITLGDVLEDSKIDAGSDKISSFKMTAVDGATMKFTEEYLYGQQRYCYPNLISGITPEEKAAGRTSADAMFVLKGNVALSPGGDPDVLTCDTLNAYRFVFGQTETEFNNGQPSLEYKVNDRMPKYVSSMTVTMKTSQTISGTSSYSKAYGAARFKLEAKAKGFLTYRSANRKVADVDSRGNVRIKGIGTAKITIIAAATEECKATTKTVTVKVIPKTNSIRKLISKKPVARNGKSAKIGSMTVYWTKDSKAGGYQIRYSRNSKFKSGNKYIAVSSGKTVDKKIAKLTRGKKYYVQVRACKKVDGKTYYGKFSTTKYIKIK